MHSPQLPLSLGLLSLLMACSESSMEASVSRDNADTGGLAAEDGDDWGGSDGGGGTGGDECLDGSIPFADVATRETCLPTPSSP